jgi:hypothetical protein
VEHAAVILAAFMATIVLRKLPVIRGWVERGVKPWACDACSASWLTLLWRLDALDGCGHWDWTGWWGFLQITAALAGCAFLLLRAYRVAEMRAGLPDLDGPRPAPESFSPPEGGDGG